MASSRILRGAVVAAAVVLLPTTANAQTPTPAERADALFKEGTKLVEQKRYAEGCAKLAESLQIETAIGTQYNLAACYELAGRVASAKHAYESAARMARQGGNAAGASKAGERASKIAALVPHVVLQIPSGVGPVRATVDAEVVPVEGSVASVEVDPGEHRVRVEAAGRVPFDKTITLAEKETQRVAVELAPVVQVAPKESPGPVAPAKQEAPPTRWSKWAGIGLVAAGGVALGVGGVLALEAKSASDDSGCRDGRYCPNSTASARLVEAKDQADLATVFVIAGAALAAGGIALWVTAPGASKPTGRVQLVPSIGQSAGGLTLVGGM